MANTLQIKRSTYNGTAAPSDSAVIAGELAMSQGSKKLYIGRQNNSGGTVEAYHLPLLTDLTVNTTSFAISDDSTDANNNSQTIVLASGIAGDGLSLNSHVLDVSVDSSQIVSGSIDLAHMSANSVDSDQYVDGSIDLIHMSDESVDSDQYVDGSIDNAHIADNAIDSEHYADGSIDNAHIADDAINSEHYAAASIDNEHLADDAVDSDELAAGAVDLAHMSANSVDSSQYVDGSIDSVHIASGTIANDRLVNPKWVVSASGSGSSDIALGATATFAGVSNETAVTESAGTVTMGLATNVTIAGNLTVSGTTTTVNSTTVTIDDPIFTLGGDTAAASDDSKDRGVEFQWHDGSAAKLGFFGMDDSDGKFKFIPEATNSSEVFSGSVGSVVFNDVSASTISDATINGGSF